MTPLVNDFIEVKAQQTYLDQQVLNVFHYQIVSIETAINYEDIADAFDNFWTTHMSTRLATALNLSSLVIRNLSNELDLFEHTSNISGSVGGNSMASFVAYGFRFNRLSSATRHGFKRFAGVTETIAAGQTIEASFIDDFQDMADAMLEGLVRTGTAADFEMLPIIIGRTLNESGVYELDITRTNGVSGVAFTGLTSQVTRKAGRGS